MTQQRLHNAKQSDYTLTQTHAQFFLEIEAYVWPSRITVSIYVVRMESSK